MKIPLALSLLVFAGCTSEKVQLADPVVQSMPVKLLKNGPQTTYIEYPASVKGTVDLEIRPQISGLLEKIYINEGAQVRKGQTLFKINDLPFKEALNNANANLQAAKAAVLNAQIEVDKLTPLVSAKVVSEFQLRSAKAAHQIAIANVAQAKAGVAAAKINLSYTDIKSPVDGYVGRLPKKQGSVVGPNDPIALTQLSDTHDVHVYFSLAEADFINFNAKYPGKTVSDRIKALPAVSLILTDGSVYAENGRVDMVDGQFDSQTGAITLRAKFANHNGILRSGNTGKIRLPIHHENVILVPQSATVEVQDKIFVYTVDPKNKVGRKPISVLATSGGDYLVNSGLRSGERIVIDGIDKLKDGDIIDPTNPNNQTIATATR
ncbi:efflux RND transporter periplasmic adaptor subunit [Arcticibacter sp.]|uniref:efflux RND transporter periplasmic adaptor subunit n=1 Tax=Arcticibacter sp. TaxID=1872630 RepID=UPI00389047D3